LRLILTAYLLIAVVEGPVLVVGPVHVVLVVVVPF
jgi:hypothetical protein